MRRVLGLFWTPKNWIIFAGLASGTLAALMTNWGNPANKGLSISCSIREIAGALGLHQGIAAQYLRPEIAGLALGAFVASLIFRDFRARGGSSPLLRFLFGAFVMIGAAVFLGCNTGTLVRLAGGDLNGITGLAGIVVGVLIGVYFMKRGFYLGSAKEMHVMTGWMIPLVMLGLIVLVITKPPFIFFSEYGAGSQYALLGIALAVGLIVGFLAQRTKMCFMGGWRDLFLAKDTYLFRGIVAFFIAALIANYLVGNFTEGTLLGKDIVYHWGFTDQFFAHDDHLWNFLSMVLVGLGATLLGGCPLRQMVLSGEGDNDAGVVVLGMLAGAALAHNFLIKSGVEGARDSGPIAVIIGLAFCLIVGFIVREKF